MNNSHHFRFDGRLAAALALVCAAGALSNHFFAAFAHTGILLFLSSLFEGEASSPRELFRRCARVPTDETAWNEFGKRYQKVINAALCKVIGFPGSAQYQRLYKEASQNFYLRLLANDRRALLNCRALTEGEACSYLKKIAVSAALNTVRYESKHFAESLDGEMVTVPASKDAGSAVISREAFERCLENFRGRNRERKILLFKLFALEALKPAEIAAIAGLGLSAHAVDIHISRMRPKLQKCFGAK